ncbi:helix-turn-helix domain-containing protein [Lentzea sp. NBRC 105346]|uniref:ArsR/SmtB family transcription factor n=1 Tax=Lentzea sp. NBRC 105346 TaxID=3032205 RepID=UPI0025521888|nr:helix-turn-helix domain-containing protein [Lentzea sp. NBRC 105346]
MVTYVDEPDKVRAALSPLRRKLLAHLREPASASSLAEVVGEPRQKINYHLRALEAAGLVELVEERQRRGCVERIMRARPGVVIDPTVMGEFTQIQDQYAAGHLVGVAAATVRDVGRMQVKADEAGKRLLTFTLEAEVRFAAPGDVHDFTDELTAAVRAVVEKYDSEQGRPYRLVAFGHPGVAS